MSPRRQIRGVLQKIVARTRADLARRREVVSRSSLEDRLELDTRDFHGALAAPGLGLIAEFKPRSPSRGDLRPDARPEDLAAAYRPYASAISVLCDGPFFGGSRQALGRIRAASGLPVLCKDFIVDPYQVVEARTAGADAVLLMVALLESGELEDLLALAQQLGMNALVEAHDADERAIAVDVGARIIGINSRDLRSLEVDIRRIEELAVGLPEGVIRVGESGLHCADDVERMRDRVDAVLMGTELMIADDPAARIEELGWTACR